MSIKYVDCDSEPDWSADRVWAYPKAWDPDRDYGDEYAVVHFILITKGFGYPKFKLEPKDHEAFYGTLKKILEPLGFEIKEAPVNDPGRDEVHLVASRGYERLDLSYPGDLSGELKKNQIKAVAEALVAGRGRVFRLRDVKIFETYRELTNAEFEEELVALKPDIRKYILNTARTTRTTKFVAADTAAANAAHHFPIPRVGDTTFSDWDREMSFVRRTVIPELIEEGCLVTSDSPNHNLLIRTINKTEQKKKKLFLNT